MAFIDPFGGIKTSLLARKQHYAPQKHEKRKAWKPQTLYTAAFLISRHLNVDESEGHNANANVHFDETALSYRKNNTLLSLA